MGRGRNTDKCQKKHKQKRVHQSKYSENIIGEKEKSKLIGMLEELTSIEGIKSQQDYRALGYLKKDSREYYQRVRILYSKYIYQ